MYKKIVIGMATLVASAFLAVPMTAHATAQSSCGTNLKQDRVDVWTYDATYRDPEDGIFNSSEVQTSRRIRLTADTRYVFCPRGDLPDLVKPFTTKFCYGSADGDPVRFRSFDGVKFNPYFFDDDSDSNPPQVKVPDDGTSSNCVTQWVENAEKEWLSMADSPGWTVSTWVVCNFGIPDVHIDMRYGSSKSKIKYFHPSQDPAWGNGVWYR